MNLFIIFLSYFKLNMLVQREQDQSSIMNYLQLEFMKKKKDDSLALMNMGSTFVRVMEYYQEEKQRFQGSEFTFSDMENFISKFFDLRITMKVKILEYLDSSLVIGKLI